MSDTATSPLSGLGIVVPVRTLAVRVASGPDAGVVAEAPSERMTVGTAQGNVLVLSDPTVSRFHLELARSDHGIVVTDLKSTNGTCVGPVRLGRGVVPVGTTLSIGRTQLEVSDGRGSTAEMVSGEHLGDLIGRTAAMRRLMAQIARVASATVSVLLIGESGTGKEVVARALHEQSPRRDQPLVVVDCGALAPGIVGSELFGHERGAFTGADRTHIGAFERAQGGTLFLDEIGELPPELQPQLLGALERRRIHRVGGKHDIEVDVRVVSATNRDLRAEVNAGTFRPDLYYRIAVVEMNLPPLRERTEDIPILVQRFLTECGHSGPVSDVVSTEALEALCTYRWPGNIRELKNWVEATLAMGESVELGRAELQQADAADDAHLDLPYKDARNVVLQRFEQAYVARLLGATHGNVSEAARRAQMDRTYLTKLVQRHRIKESPEHDG